MFRLFNVLEAIKWRTTALKNYIHGLRSDTSSLTTCFSWLIQQHLAQYNAKYRRISHPISFLVGHLAVPTIEVLHSCGATCQQSAGKQACSKLHIQAEQAKFCFNMLFQFQNKVVKLNCLENLKSKKSFSYCSFFTVF